MKIVIIGSVAAGTSVAAKARRNDEQAEIVIYEKDKYISYSSCGMPYYLGEEYITLDNLTPRDPAWFKKRFNIDIKIKNEVIDIDAKGKKIKVKNLETGETFDENYDKLVLATGSTAFKPPIKGIENPNVFTLKNINHMKAIETYIKEKKVKSAAIVGAGFIGLELLENLHKRGIKTTLVEAAKHVMPQLDPEMSQRIEDYLTKKEIPLYTDKGVTEIDEQNKEIKLQDGEKIPADMVVIAAGVRPEVTLAVKAGAEIGETGAIRVNKKMETTIKDIYAVGDSAESYSLITGKPIYRPLGSTANKMGRIAGDIITGGDITFRGILGTGILKVFELAIGFTGLTEKEARKEGYEVEIIHNIKEDKSKYLKESREITIKAVSDKKSGKLLGVQAIGESGVDKRIDVFATAITLGATVEDLFHMDLAYAPPFATTKDPVLYTGMVLNNSLNRNRKIIKAEEIIKNPEKYRVIDVRSEKDYSKGHIPGAENIPLAKLREEIGRYKKEEPMVVHCNKGGTGNAAQNLLINLGYKEVYNLSGGYKEYKIEKKVFGK